MQHTILDFTEAFAVALGNPRSQAAVMVLPAGESTGHPHNEHAGSDQWLFVIAGEGKAVVDNQIVNLRQGSLLLIEQREPHSITNTGAQPLKTLNFYVPPAYQENGDLIRR